MRSTDLATLQPLKVEVAKCDYRSGDCRSIAVSYFLQGNPVTKG